MEERTYKVYYEDAARIGLKITGFDLGRAQECTGKLTAKPLSVIRNILSEHGPTCETYQTAKRYEEIFVKLEEARNTEDGFTEEQEEQYEKSEQEFERDLLEDYRINLSQEFDYLTGREAIIETLEANDYDFTEDGKID